MGYMNNEIGALFECFDKEESWKYLALGVFKIEIIGSMTWIHEEISPSH